MFQRHCSDEKLLSHLDGELSPQAAELVRQHLQRCWSCRRRAAELENTLHSLSKVIDGVDHPDPLWLAETRLKIEQRQRQIDRDLAAIPKLGMLRGGARPKLLVPAVCAASLLLALVIWWYGERPIEPTAAEVIALARTAEVEIHQQPTRQVFRVEFAQVHPEPKQYSRRLEIWSDPTGERSAARWKGPAGDLKHAVYRPERGRHYIYDPEVTPTAVLAANHSPKLVSVAEIGQNGHQVEELEAGFLRWLEGRQWQPLALVPGLASFASRDGAILDLERIRLPGGQDAMRVTARRAGEDLSVEILLEVDSREYRPRFLRLRFETPQRVVHVRLIPEEQSQISAARLSPEIFEPDYPQHVPAAPVATNRLPAMPPIEAPAHETPPRPLPSELIATEIEARYALHRAGACLGDPIEIVHSCENVRISGVVSSSERKNELIAALGEIEATPWLMYDLRTIAEALAAQEVSHETDRREIPDESASADALAMRIAGHRLPIEDHLERYFRAQWKSTESGPQELDESIRQLAAQVVTLSGDALADAWALRRLVEANRREWTARQPSRSRWLLEAMFRDHLNELHAKVGQIRRLVEPALSEVAKPSVVANADQAAPSADKGSLPAGGARVLEVFGSVENVRSQVLSLFADGAPPSDTKNPEASGRLSLGSPEETARLLLDILPMVEAETRSLRESRGLDFVQDEASASAYDPCGWDGASL